MTQQKLMMVDEFLYLITLPDYAERRLELIDGEVVEVSPKLNHGLNSSVIHGEVYIFLKDKPIGRVMFEVDHYLPDDKKNTRRPDVSYISNERLVPLDENDAVPLMPDLAVEVKSPSNYITGLEGLREKARYYLANGSRLVWLVYPDKRIVEVYTADSADILTEKDVLDGGDVLPGFKLPVKAIFS
jgi:Uma2 family endonuclease